MSIDVRVPSTGNAGEDAVIADWLVEVGTQVSEGDVLVTIETAKATMEVESPASGQLLKILYASGDEAPEHEVLAVIGEPGESLPDSDAPAQPAQAQSADATNTANTTAPATAPAATDAAATKATPSTSDRLRVSPRARILAERNSVDLATVTGSGPGGRIIVSDVLAARANAASEPKSTAAASAATTTAPSPTPAAQPKPVDAEEYTVVPVRGPRKITAQRMHASLQSTAQVTLTRYADATALFAYVSRVRAVTDAESLPKIGVNDALMFATAKAVAKHPAANSTFDWEGIRQYTHVNLGFAVDTGQALLVPVINGADTLSLAQLAESSKALIGKAREGKLSLPEMEGGTFTVTNLGGLGIHWFTPVLNAPQSCILGIGAAHRAYPDAPAQLPLSLTFDHRAIDGAGAAVLLAEIAHAIDSADTLAAF